MKNKLLVFWYKNYLLKGGSAILFFSVYDIIVYYILVLKFVVWTRGSLYIRAEGEVYNHPSPNNNFRTIM